MSRISIDVTPEEHRKLKAVAALSGKTIKQYVMERALSDDAQVADDLAALEAYLEPRIKSAKQGEVSGRSARDILNAVRAKK